MSTEDTVFACIITSILTIFVCIILGFAINSTEDSNRVIDCGKHTDLSIESCESIVMDKYKSK